MVRVEDLLDLSYREHVKIIISLIDIYLITVANFKYYKNTRPVKRVKTYVEGVIDRFYDLHI